MKKLFITLSIFISFFFVFSINKVSADSSEDETFIINEENSFLNKINSNNQNYIEFYNNLISNLNSNYKYVLFKNYNNDLYIIRSRHQDLSLYFYDDRLGKSFEIDEYTQYSIIDENNINSINWINDNNYLKIWSLYDNAVLLTNYDKIIFEFNSKYDTNTNALFSFSSYRYARYYYNNDNCYKYESYWYFLKNNNNSFTFYEKNQRTNNSYYYINSYNNLDSNVENFINSNNSFNNIDLKDNYIISTYFTGEQYKNTSLLLITFTNEVEKVSLYNYSNSSGIHTYFNFNLNINYTVATIYYLKIDNDNNLYWEFVNNSYISNTLSNSIMMNNKGKIFKSNVNIYDENDEVYFNQNTTPTMSLKGMYNSNDEDIFEVGKVSVYFQESDTTIDKFKYVNFRLQTISNDLKEENIPIFSHYKVYGKTEDQSDSSDYELIDFSEFEYEDEENGKIVKKGMNFIVTNDEYDFIENRMAMSMLELKLSFLENANTKYEYWKIEFYFDNAQNGTINVYDSLENSLWRCEPKFVDEYDFYYFPSNYKYAYISSENYQNTGRVYFPTNSILNPEILLQAQYFNINIGTYESPLETHNYNDTFYSYVDFDFNNSKQLLVLNRLKGKKELTEKYGFFGASFNVFTKNHFRFYGNNYLYTYSPEIINGVSQNLNNIFGYDKELTYFYVPKGYTVVFSDGTGNYQINTGNGFITINEDNNTNIYESSEKNKSVSLGSVLQEIIDMFGNATKPLEKTKDIYNLFRNYNIGKYVFLVIITSTLILVVKSFRR